jgi:hypothetical protein
MDAEGSMPRDPVSMDASSERMSPKMLPVTIVSKYLGLRMSCIAALSMYLWAVQRQAGQYTGGKHAQGQEVKQGASCEGRGAKLQEG